MTAVRAAYRSEIWGISMRRAIEHFFEAIEANVSYAVVAVVASLAVTGCLRLLWE